MIHAINSRNLEISFPSSTCASMASLFNILDGTYIQF